jgi:hypothetical protein
MTCSGVRGTGPASNTHPVWAIRLQPFSPVPRRFSKFLTRWAGALAPRRRSAPGSIATPLQSAEISNGPAGTSCPGPCSRARAG